MLRTLAIALLVLLALPAPAPAAADGACGGAVAQNDAGSGGDAGADGGAALALAAEGHYDGTLVPAGDGVDGFRVALAGDGGIVMVEAYPLLKAANGDGSLAPYTVGFGVEAWAPGADAATHQGYVTTSGAVNATFQDTVAGVWLLRVVAGPPGACDAAGGLRSAAVATTPHNYRMYFGCEPHCLE